jgi:hypothetical protein
MEDSQRSAMYEAWKSSKINLTPTINKDKDGVTICVMYNGVEYSETFLYKDLYGSADAYNIAYNRLLGVMHKINKNIEIKYF